MFTLSCKAGVGIADWGNALPGGAGINNFQGEYPTLYAPDGDPLVCMREWYFYKNCVIGISEGEHLFVYDLKAKTMDSALLRGPTNGGAPQTRAILEHRGL